MPDWVIEQGFEVDPKKLTVEQVEKATKKGYRIVHDADSGKTTVTERVIIEGGKK